jgi:hypothetical protein
MSATKAFDLALFVPVPANVNDGVVVNALGPPFTTVFKPIVTSVNSGVTVGSSVPAATAQNQILISGAGPGFAWALGTNPAAAASVPAPTAQYNLVMADATPSWQNTDIPTVLARGGAITASVGGTFAVGANLVFTPSGALAKRIDGSDPNFSQLDNFTLDCGTF